MRLTFFLESLVYRQDWLLHLLYPIVKTFFLLLASFDLVCKILVTLVMQKVSVTLLPLICLKSHIMGV